MNWQEMLPKGWRVRGDKTWSAMELSGPTRLLFIQCGGSLARGDGVTVGWLTVSHDYTAAPPWSFSRLMPRDTPLGQAIREIPADPSGWPALLDLLMDDPEAGPHVRRVLEAAAADG